MLSKFKSSNKLNYAIVFSAVIHLAAAFFLSTLILDSSSPQMEEPIKIALLEKEMEPKQETEHLQPSQPVYKHQPVRENDNQSRKPVPVPSSSEKSESISVDPVKSFPSSLVAKMEIAQPMLENNVPSRRVKTSLMTVSKPAHPYSPKSSFSSPTQPAELKTAHVIQPKSAFRPVTMTAESRYSPSRAEIKITRSTPPPGSQRLTSERNVHPLSKLDHPVGLLVSEESTPRVEPQGNYSKISPTIVFEQPFMDKEASQENVDHPKIIQVAYHPSLNNPTNLNIPQQRQTDLPRAITHPGQPVALAQVADFPSHHSNSNFLKVSVLRPGSIDSDKNNGLKGEKNIESNMKSVPGSFRVEVKAADLDFENYLNSRVAALAPVSIDSLDESLIARDELQKIREGFTSQVRKKLALNKRYPKIARKRGYEGNPIVTFTLAKSGDLLDVSIEQSSQYEVLDYEAIQTVKNAAPYPPIPDQLQLESMQFKIPISYVLK